MLMFIDILFYGKPIEKIYIYILISPMVDNIRHQEIFKLYFQTLSENLSEHLMFSLCVFSFVLFKIHVKHEDK